jgi:RNA polymerase-binding transcription factor DksA
MFHILLTASACKHRWFNLRDQCRRAIKNKRITRGKEAMKYKKWKFVDETAFLSPYFQESETLSNIHETNENKGNNGSVIMEQGPVECVKSENEVGEDRLTVSNIATFVESSKAKEAPEGSSDITSSLMMKYNLEKKQKNITFQSRKARSTFYSPVYLQQ